MKNPLSYRACKICGNLNPGKKNYCGKHDEPGTCAHKYQKEYVRLYHIRNKVKYQKPKKERDIQIYSMVHLNQY